MDRGRYRALLSWAVVGGAALLARTATLPAQTPPPAPPASPSPALATPWVQASPPPPASPAKPPGVTIRVDKEGRYYFDKEKDALSVEALTERLRKLRETRGDNLQVLVRAGSDAKYETIVAALDRARDAGLKNVSFSVPAANDNKAPAPAPPPSPPPGASPSREEIARAMARQREEELSRLPPSSPPPKPPRAEPRLSPEERGAYEHNLGLWLALPPEERQALRGQAAERIREETEKAYAGSGLNLNDDQREVFALRYRQERRRLEREIQEKAAAERARRLPEIMDRLKREFPAAAPVK